MSSFKEMLANDVNVFLNESEFAETHVVTTYDKNGNPQHRELPMIVENFHLDGRPFEHGDGVSAIRIVVYIKPEVLAYTPRVDQAFHLDHAKYIVDALALESGILRISMSANRGRP